MLNQDLGTEPIGKLLLKYSTPAIIGTVISALYNVIDRMFIGNIPDIGSLAITGLGVTLPIMSIIVAFSSLIGVGAVTNISLKLGDNDRETAEKVLGNALLLAVIIGFMITIVGSLFSEPILRSFGASAESLPYAKAYIDIIFMGSIFSILASSLNNLIRGDGSPKLSALIMIVGCLINIVLDALFIFGFGWGIEGAALATVISQMITSIWGLAYYVRGKSNLKLYKANLKLHKKFILLIVSIGLAPFTLQAISSAVQVFANNALRTYGGDMAIGAMATVNSFMIMFGMPIIGLTQGAQPIIGFNFGAKQYDRAEKALKFNFIVSMIWLTFCWALIMLFADQIVRIFTSDPEFMTLSADAARKYLSVFPLMATSVLVANYVQSIGKVKPAIFLSLLRQVILLLPLLAILPRFLGLDGVWFAQPTSDAISTIIAIIILRHTIKTYRAE